MVSRVTGLCLPWANLPLMFCGLAGPNSCTAGPTAVLQQFACWERETRSTSPAWIRRQLHACRPSNHLVRNSKTNSIFISPGKTLSAIQIRSPYRLYLCLTPLYTHIPSHDLRTCRLIQFRHGRLQVLPLSSIAADRCCSSPSDHGCSRGRQQAAGGCRLRAGACRPGRRDCNVAGFFFCTAGGWSWKEAAVDDAGEL